MNSAEKKLLKRLQQEIPDISPITPGVVIDVHHKGKRKALLHYGKTYDFYDLASLTKIIFTASNAMNYFSEHKKDIKAPVAKKLEWWKGRITSEQLMQHTAGLEWWLPMYQQLKGPTDPETRWEELKKILAQTKPLKRKNAVYSDVDLWMLGSYLEAAKEKSLIEMWNETQDRFNVEGLWFQPNNIPKYDRERYAPTESCPWRHKTLQGEVHDDNTWALGGVAPHAGLFGTIEAVSDWGMQLRKALKGKSKAFGDSKLAKRFVGRRIPRKIGDFRLSVYEADEGKGELREAFFSGLLRTHRLCGHVILDGS